MKHILLLISVLWGGMVHAQQSKVFLQVKPSKAIVVLDGDTLGNADGSEFWVGFNERKDLILHEAEIIADGYNPFVQELPLGMPKKSTYRITLERSLPSLKESPDYIIDFDKALSGIEYYTEVGNKAYWMFRYDEELEVGQTYYTMLENFKKIGFNTKTDDKGNPLLDADQNPIKPTVVVKAQIQELKVDRRPNAYLGNTANSNIAWAFIDQVTKDTLHADTIASSLDFESSDINNVLPNVFLESFYVLFFRNRPLMDTLSKHSLQAALDQKEAERIAALPPEEKIDSVGQDSAMLDSLTTDTLGMDSSNTSQESMAPSIQAKESKTPPKTAALATGGIYSIERPGSIRRLTKQVPLATVAILDGGNRAGSVVASDGHIITLQDKEEEGDTLRVLFANGIILDAQVLVVHDGVALLKVDAKKLTGVKLTVINGPAMETKLLIPDAPEEGRNYSDIVPSKLQSKTSTGFLMTSDAHVHIGAPVLLGSGEMIGIVKSHDAGEIYEVLNAAELINVFNLSYE